jgi:hypothetical protein
MQEKHLMFMRAVSTSNTHQTLIGKAFELITLIKGVDDWLRPTEST